MPHTLTDQDAREELRYAVRRYLAARPTAACPLDMIIPGLRAKGLDPKDADVLEQLTYWINTDPPEVKMVRPQRHGAGKAWQITSAGVVAEERGE